MKKYFNRISAVIANSFFLTLPGVTNQLLSIVIVRFYNVEWWGKIAVLQYVFALSSSVVAWGNKEYLLREYSTAPANISSLFQKTMFSRSILLALPLGIIPFLGFRTQETLFVLLWIVLRFISQSFESLITFHRKFTVGIVCEIISLAAMITGIIVLKNPTYENFLQIISVSLLARTLSVSFFFRDNLFIRSPMKWNAPVLYASLPFAMLIMGGFIHSQADMLCVIHYLSKKEIAHFQIITAGLLFIQSTSNFVFAPFAKTFYRLTARHMRKPRIMFLTGGFACVIFGLTAMYFALGFLYGIALTPTMLIAGIFYSYLPFTYLLSVYTLYKRRKTGWVFAINILGTALLIIMYRFFFLLNKLDIENAIIATAMNHFLVAVCFWYAAHLSTKQTYVN